MSRAGASAHNWPELYNSTVMGDGNYPRDVLSPKMPD